MFESLYIHIYVRGVFVFLQILAVGYTIMLCLGIATIFLYQFRERTYRTFFVLDNSEIHKQDSLDLGREWVAMNNQRKAVPRSVGGPGLLMMFRTRDGSNILQDKYIKQIMKFNLQYLDPQGFYRNCLSSESGFPNCSLTSNVDPFWMYPQFVQAFQVCVYR